MGRPKKRGPPLAIEERGMDGSAENVVDRNTEEDNPVVWMGGSLRNSQTTRSDTSRNPDSSCDELEDQEEPPKKRGTSTLPKIWKITKPANRKAVQSNKHGQPVGKYATQFSTFIGILVKIHCELDKPNFTKVEDDSKITMMEVLMEKFKIPHTLSTWIQKAMSKKYRDYKSELKARYFSHDDSFVTNLKHCPENVKPEQWRNLVKYWMSDEGKLAEKRARRSRSHQKVTHTTGSKSFARVGSEMEEELEEEPGEIKLYETTHKKKDGSYSDPSVQEIVEKAMAKKAETGASVGDEAKILHEVLGNSRNGIMRGMGMGPTPSSVFGPFSAVESNAHATEKIERLQNQLAQQGNELETLKRQVAQLLGQQQTPQEGNLASSSHSSHRPAVSPNQATI